LSKVTPHVEGEIAQAVIAFCFQILCVSCAHLFYTPTDCSFGMQNCQTIWCSLEGSTQNQNLNIISPNINKQKLVQGVQFGSWL